MDLEKIRYALERVNIQRMAGEIGVSKTALYKVRDGDNTPRLDTAIKIIAYLKKLSEGC